jgi:hypothetical protein
MNGSSAGSEGEASLGDPPGRGIDVGQCAKPLFFRLNWW